jgi:hypothetical protein
MTWPNSSAGIARTQTSRPLRPKTLVAILEIHLHMVVTYQNPLIRLFKHYQRQTEL